jgi:hypothetical protein
MFNVLKERKCNEFFPEVVVGTVDITLKTSHGQIITSNIKHTHKKKCVLKACSDYAIFVTMATDDQMRLLPDPSAAQNWYYMYTSWFSAQSVGSVGCGTTIFCTVFLMCYVEYFTYKFDFQTKL